jgi:hypothetical protein
MAASLACFKPIEGLEYVLVGCNDNDPCRRSGAPFLRRVRWNVWLADERIVPAANSSVHCGSSLCMKRDALLPLSPVKRKTGGTKWKGNLANQAFRSVFSRSRISVRSFSSLDGPTAGAGFLKRFTCLITRNKQKAMIRNSITVLINIP